MINPNEAPAGYQAREETSTKDPCNGCAFLYEKTKCSKPAAPYSPCVDYDRKDGHAVIFKKAAVSPSAGTSYRIVTVALLVPEGAEGFMDTLSDFRDDNPDQLVQWVQLGDSVGHLPRQAAEAAWLDKYCDKITIKEAP